MKKHTWYKIAESKAALFMDGKTIINVEAGGKKICVAAHNGKLYGCAAKCPHAGGWMEDGWIDATGNIVCPLHRYKFSLENGRNVSGEGYYLKTYPLEEKTDGIYIGIENSGFFNW